ncbi:MAG: hypothetical protein ACI9FU_000160 [Granulosicoccus sp.]|jgi:hypothetical protein
MRIAADTIDEYMANVPEERQEAFNRLWKVITDNIPAGFEPALGYGFPSYVVPHSTYPDGYHCKPTEPLPFLSIANQKNFVSLYHMGIYADIELMEWFTSEFPKHVKGKLDMGKSCIRFKKMDQIPYELIAELVGKMSTEKWINTYESAYKKK